MKTIIFCPTPELGNTLEERYKEQAIAEAFDGKVISLIYHQGDTDEELFDLTCDCDMVVVMTNRENEAEHKAFKVLNWAMQLQKPVYQVQQKAQE